MMHGRINRYLLSFVIFFFSLAHSQKSGSMYYMLFVVVCSLLASYSHLHMDDKYIGVQTLM